MSRFKLEFKLKQHTPLIHFQHHQSGATLRATELKPKLDRFLIEHIFNNNFKRYKNYLVGYDGKQRNPSEKDALDYKVKIFNNDNVKYYLPYPFISNNKKQPLIDFIREKAGIEISLIVPSPYFANADKVNFRRVNGSFEVDELKTKMDDLRFAVLSETEISVFIDTFNTELGTAIKNIIVSFFLSHNFGARQNKGFGSFTVASINGEKVKIDNEQVKAVLMYHSKRKFTEYSSLFRFILDEYQLLKSGKNHPKYQKSKLFNYFINRNVRWEKRYIKQYFNTPTNRIMNQELYWDKKPAPIDIEKATGKEYNDWTDKQTNNYGFIRALLGLSEQFEYLVFKKEKNKKTGIYEKVTRNGVPLKDSSKRYVVTVEHKPQKGREKIERFKSPIFFKVIEGEVFLGVNDSYQNILGEEFTFRGKLKEDKRNTVKSIGNLNVPSSFDLKDFIQNYISSNWDKL